MANSIIFGAKPAIGDAIAADLLSGKTATTSTAELTGTMINNGTYNITPSTSNQTIPQGYHSGSGVVYAKPTLVIQTGEGVANPSSSVTITLGAIGSNKKPIYLAGQNTDYNSTGTGTYYFEGYNGSSWVSISTLSDGSNMSGYGGMNTYQVSTILSGTSTYSQFRCNCYANNGTTYGAHFTIQVIYEN